MDQCSHCGKERLLDVSAKCSDLCAVRLAGQAEFTDGYVPRNIGIGGGDYVEFTYCLDCGMIQGDFPVDTPGSEGD